ncbi:hypothetical protein C8R44DRAFT_782778 [Mycena epipterygia]|nr:hypothetical protein C8R44DRAFT_782778 [Mycena epipterygia]
MEISKTITTIVSLLGGPELNPEDIDWASDLPAGRKLLEWLVSQVQPELDGTGVEFGPIRAALQAIALEDDELRMLHATGKGAIGESGPRVPSGYVPPWRLRAKEHYMGVEASRLETETEVLKSRLHQTKIASQRLSQTIKIIASELEKTDDDILAAEDRLSELSLNADAAILASVHSSFSVLDAFVPNNDSAQDESPQAGLLSAASSVGTAITTRFHSQMRAIDAAASRLPTPSELHTECARLDTALNKPRAGANNLISLASDAAFNDKVKWLCQALEDPDTGRDALATVLAKDLERGRDHPPAIDVKAELECAWALDQAGLLDVRGAVLDEAIAAFSGTVLPPLTALHDDLAATNSSAREAQALVQALQEEIQDVVQDLRAAQDPHGNADVPVVDTQAKDAELQAGLVNLLKQLKDLRPRDSPPLVLLSQEDILSELRSVYERAEISRHQEDAWAADLLPTLRKLEAAHAPLLDVAYAHSPMNTSPPFGFPVDVQAIQAGAKTSASDLGDAVVKLQKEVKTLDTDRAKRRLEHFVTKWAQ